MPLWALIGFGMLVSTIILIVILDYIRARTRRNFGKGAGERAIKEVEEILRGARKQKQSKPS